jgi:hypothetical protein
MVYMNESQVEEERKNRQAFDHAFNEEINSVNNNEFFLLTCIPSKEVIQNFCKNVIISSKMEKEVPVISLVYIERLLIKSQFGLSRYNWKKILFTALVLASKIWDDESFENENFAKAFNQYKTSDINKMERIFLAFIDYNLYISSQEYAKYYFVLRSFVSKSKKSFPLRPLDLKTIIYLQRNSNKAERALRE